MQNPSQSNKYRVVNHEPNKPTKSQAQFMLNCANPEYVRNFFVGGIGCGKTHCMTQMLLDLSQIPGNKVAVVRKWRKDIEETTYSEFLDHCPPEMIQQVIKSEMKLIMRTPMHQYPSIIEFKGMDDRLRWGGTYFAHILVDECSELDKLEFYTLEGRLRHKFKKEIIKWLEQNDSPYLQEFLENGEYVLDVHRFVGAITNPVDELNWIYETCVSEKAVSTSLVMASTYENYVNLPRQYQQIIDNYPKQLKFTKVLGNWGKDTTGTPVTPSFDVEIHVKDFQIPQFPIELYEGLDFGFSRPAWGLWYSEDGILYKIAEKLGYRTHLEKFMKDIQTIKKKLNLHPDCTNHLWVDHSAGLQHSMAGDKPAIEKLKDMGFKPKHKRTSPADRMDLMETLFHNKKIFLHSSCELSKNAYAGGWCRDEKNPDEADKSPGNPYHNIADADGYALMGFFGPIGRERIHQRQLASLKRRPVFKDLGIGVMYHE